MKRELELERGIRKELEQAKKLLERECHEREQAVQIVRQQVSIDYTTIISVIIQLLRVWSKAYSGNKAIYEHQGYWLSLRLSN